MVSSRLCPERSKERPSPRRPYSRSSRRPCRDGSVGGDHCARVAECSEILRRIEAERGDVRDHRGSVRLRRILDHTQPMLPCQLEQRQHIRLASVEVHGDKRPRPRPHGLGGRARVERERSRIDVGEHRCRARKRDSGDRRHAGVGRSNHVVARRRRRRHGAQSRSRRSPNRRRPHTPRRNTRRTRPRTSNSVAADEAALCEDTRRRRAELYLQLGCLPAQVVKRDPHQ